MALQTWPAGVRGNDGRIRKDGFETLPEANILRSEMDDGFKTRREFTRGLSRMKVPIRMPLDELGTFEVWVRDTLKSGTRPFRFNVPFRAYDVAATLVPQDKRAYAVVSAPGANVIVTLELEFIDRALP